MVVLKHLIVLMHHLYSGKETTERTDNGKRDGFQLPKALDKREFCFLDKREFCSMYMHNIKL